ncbi:hypothetical protein [Streptomyces canus]|uniref:hypothetical protein n=1 Tax=Streptomyces canus TaxID=58343 RepID=UPI00358E3D44
MTELFGADRVVTLDRAVAEERGLSGADAEVLCEVGVPVFVDVLFTLDTAEEGTRSLHRGAGGRGWRRDAHPRARRPHRRPRDAVLPRHGPRLPGFICSAPAFTPGVKRIMSLPRGASPRLARRSRAVLTPAGSAARCTS